jgi:hypothetical protein
MLSEAFSTESLLSSLAAKGLVGEKTPELAAALGGALIEWALTVRVGTTDTGAVGAGTSIFSFSVPSSVVSSNFELSRTSALLFGVSAADLAAALADGVSLTFAAVQVSTVHAGVGSGAGVALFSAPPAQPIVMGRLLGAGFSGSDLSRLADLFASALDQTLPPLSLPIVIAGPAGPSPAAGVGTGSLV